MEKYEIVIPGLQTCLKNTQAFISCTCIWRTEVQRMRFGDFLSCWTPLFKAEYLNESGAHQFGKTFWSANPKDLLVSNSLMLGLQVCTTVSMFIWVLRINCVFSCIHGKHFTNLPSVHLHVPLYEEIDSFSFCLESKLLCQWSCLCNLIDFAHFLALTLSFQCSLLLKSRKTYL